MLCQAMDVLPIYIPLSTDHLLDEWLVFWGNEAIYRQESFFFFCAKENTDCFDYFDFTSEGVQMESKGGEN